MRSFQACLHRKSDLDGDKEATRKLLGDLAWRKSNHNGPSCEDPLETSSTPRCSD